MVDDLTTVTFIPLGQQRNHVFAKKMQALARKGTQLFACIMRHCVDADYIFDDLVGKMVVSDTWEYSKIVEALPPADKLQYFISIPLAYFLLRAFPCEFN